MKFIVDENIGEKFARGMKEFGEDVEFVAAHCGRAASDTDILEKIGKNGWGLITRDKALRYKYAEKTLIKEYRIKSFCLRGGELSGCRIVQILVKAWPNIKDKALSNEGPYIWQIQQNGHLDKKPLRP